MENMQYIEDYFKGAISPETQQAFEQKIISDPSFAQDVAFYVSVNGLLTEQVKLEKKERFRELYQQHKATPAIIRPIKTIWKYMAAASVLAAIILSTWFFAGQKNSGQFADQYIQQNFKTISVTMGSQDSLQAGVNLFNEGKFVQALAHFETMITKDAANIAAQKNAGIAALRLGQYDKALTYFTNLEANANIYINPGKFYKAVTLLERNSTGDKATAKSLLQEVVQKNLAESDTAKEWLKKL